MIKVLPSSNLVQESKLIEFVKTLEDLGVEYLHCDVMDGVFVSNKCLSFDVLEHVRNNTNICLDVHLMISKPTKEIKKYISIKPNIITVHYEAFKNKRAICKLAKKVRSKDILFGVSIKPNTPASALIGLLDDIDLVLIMSVEPGKSGQSFIESSLQKIKDVKVLCEDRSIIIEVDGGINLDNFKAVVDAGASLLVMGSAFYNAENKSELLNKIDKHYKKSKN